MAGRMAAGPPSSGHRRLGRRMEALDLLKAADGRAGPAHDHGAQLPELVVRPFLYDKGDRIPERQGRDLAGHRRAARSLDRSAQREEIHHLVEIVGCGHTSLPGRRRERPRLLAANCGNPMPKLSAGLR